MTEPRAASRRNLILGAGQALTGVTAAALLGGCVHGAMAQGSTAAADPAVSRAAADKATGSTRPLSAGGGSNGSDSWHLTASATERRAAKAKATGGGDPWPELGLPLSSRPAPVAGLAELARLPLPDAAVHSAAPRHHFDGRAPPQGVL